MAIEFDSVAKEMQRRVERKKEIADPLYWVEHRLGEFAWSKQAEVLRSVRDHKRTLVASCHGSGKTHIASRVAGWWLDSYPNDPNETRVITTAPSWQQVANIMWAYIAGVQKKIDMPGNITTQAAWTFPGFKAPTAFGRKPADYDESTFQGIHSTYVLAIIDEAGGVPENIFTSVETITTNKHARILAIANPDDPSSYMAKIWREQEKLPPEKRKWNLIRISAFDTPNFTGEWVPERARDNLLQREWVEDAEERWGKDDPRYKSKVLAQFPDLGVDGLFNLGKLAVSSNGYDDFEPVVPTHRAIGVDVGLSETGDFSVVTLYDNGKIRILDKVKGYDGNRLGKLIGDRAREHKVTDIRVDAVGVGRGVQSVLGNYVDEGTEIYWVIGNAKSPDEIKWYNFRAAMYDHLSNEINRGNVAIPYDEYDPERTAGLFDEFRSISYEFRGTKILIKSKEEIKKKGGHSPDVLDSICYAALPKRFLTAQEESLIDTDTIMDSTEDDYSPVDDWGNEEWSFAPA